VTVRPTEPVEPDELSKMRGVLDRRRRDDVRMLAMLVPLALGLRRGEVIALNVGDLKTVAGVLSFRVRTLKQRGKKRERLAPVTDPDDAALLERYTRWEHGDEPDPGAPLYLTSATRHPFRRTRLTPKAVEHRLKRLAARAGIERRVHPHALRHGFATGLLRSGADLKSVQELMGHQSLASTERYLHSNFARQVEAVRRLGPGG
jgi:integrase/recombinase XerC